MARLEQPSNEEKECCDSKKRSRLQASLLVLVSRLGGVAKTRKIPCKPVPETTDGCNDGGKLITNTSLVDGNKAAISNADFKPSGTYSVSNSGLLSNPPEARTNNENLHVPIEELRIYQAKVRGSNKHDLITALSKYLGLWFRGIININDICRNLLNGFYLVESGFNGYMKHCTALFKMNNILEYFDSAGNPPPNIDTTIFSIINRYRVQHNANNTCGHHSAYYIYERYQGFSMEEIIDSYPNKQGGNLEENCTLVVKHFEKLRNGSNDSYFPEFDCKESCNMVT